MKTLNACLLGLLLLPSPTLADSITGIRQVPLLTNDLVYDAAEGTIYASVPGSVGASGNRLTPIAPGTGTVGSGVFVGSEPTTMAISDNDQFIYVALGGANAVSRFNLATHTTDLQFFLGNDPFFGPRFAGDLVVVPGNPHAVVVSEFNPNVSPSFAGLVVFDNGVQRPNAYLGFTGGESIAFAGSPTKIYGIDNETTGFEFNRFNINSSGITLQDTTPGLVPGFGATIRGADGLIYVNTGRLIDPAALTVVGTYAGVPNGSFEAIDPALNRVYFISSDGILRVYDEAQFTLLNTFTIPGMVGSPDSLITWGTDGLAFGTSSGQVFLIDAVVPEPASFGLLATGLLEAIGYYWWRGRARR